ncbi:hypothetical protein F5Y00DRAFT_266300 [Daldinia vernicosa]|uniref:uncharacterized protein n=1 Tax=Daldinia vernicosa TaxID=114800 RepID=UPI00200766B9|nr:uncharacterized protein F5Y00DRAFT_266300 [Daldinia vernicosa]KAI0844671.1 hypothetical protein F5Y00DRAFT_266300 [Daldinia vernicosa]
MPSPSPILVYVIGAGSVFLGIHCFLRPEVEYRRFGLPLEPAHRQKHNTGDEEYASPVIHLKGIRETTYGLALGALQYHGYDGAVTIMTAVMSLAGLGDGIVVWLYGGDEARGKAFGHWGAFAALAGLFLWRTYGDVHG